MDNKQIAVQIKRLFLIKNKENYINEVAIIKQRIHALNHHSKVHFFKLLTFAKLQLKMEKIGYHVLGNNTITKLLPTLKQVKTSNNPLKPVKWVN